MKSNSGRGIAIPINSPNWKPIMEILRQFSTHSKICPVCNPVTGDTCLIGDNILRNLNKFPEIKRGSEINLKNIKKLWDHRGIKFHLCGRKNNYRYWQKKNKYVGVGGVTRIKSPEKK